MQTGADRGPGTGSVDRREYRRNHERVYRLRGVARYPGQWCADCDNPAEEWSQVHGMDGTDPFAHFELRCRPCHCRYDGCTPAAWKVVAAGIAKRIRRGELAPGTELPAGRLAVEYGVTISMVYRAMVDLTGQGLTELRAGTCVTRQPWL